MVDIKPEKLLLPEEVDIYEQGLKQDFDAGLIGRWIGKFEGVCDLSMRWESGDNDFYKDYLLDEVFDNCIRKLKKPGRVFGSVEAMNRYFTEHSEFMLNLKGRGWAYTFRILTNLFAFYFFFLPTDDGCDFFIYVFDKKTRIDRPKHRKGSKREMRDKVLRPRDKCTFLRGLRYACLFQYRNSGVYLHLCNYSVFCEMRSDYEA